jgi:replicative DNA helicase
MDLSAYEPDISEVKKLPSDIEAEWSMIVMAIEDNDILVQMLGRLTPEHFYDYSLADIWQALNLAYDKFGVGDEAKCRGFLKDKELVPARYLYEMGLGFNEPSKGTDPYWAERIEAAAFRRNMICTARKMFKRACREDDESDEIELVAAANSLMDELNSLATTGDLAAHSRADLISAEVIDCALNPNRNLESKPVPTDLPLLNGILNGGFNAQEHCFIGARPGMGKTAFALWNVAWASACRDIPTVFFSIEMSREQLMTRLLCTLTGIPGKRINSGDLTPAQQTKLSQTQALIDNKPLYIVDTCVDVKSICAQIQRMKNKVKCRLVVIDYIQLLMAGGEDAYKEITAAIAKLTRTAKQCKVSIVSLSQLNRGVESRADKRPMISDFAWSDKIGQDGAMVLALYRDSYYNDMGDRSQGEILILKNRHGREKVMVPVGWDGSLTKYYDIPVYGNSYHDLSD